MVYQSKNYRKFIAAATTATLVASTVTPLVSAATVADFKDVAPQYQAAVQFLLDTGATNGLTKTTFGTYENITRQDAAVQLVRVLGLEVDETVTKTKFVDVPARTAKYVDVLVKFGITNGKSENTFGASDKITRGELAVWIQRGFELEVSGEVSFNDVNNNYINAVLALVNNNIAKGKTETIFGTNEHATRGQFAIFLYRAAVEENVAVENVSIINGTELLVKFTKEVDEETAETLTNYTITDIETSVATAKVQEDGKSVLLTLTHTVLTGDLQMFDITIKDILLKDSLTEKFPLFSKLFIVRDTE